MIRQGGNHLVLKVVTVTRNLDPDDTARKKGVCPSRCPAGGAKATERRAGLFSAESHGNGVSLKFVIKAMTLSLSHYLREVTVEPAKETKYRTDAPAPLVGQKWGLKEPF